MKTYTIVAGAVSTVADLGKDESWLQGWLKEDPRRLGLGDLKIADGDPVQDEDGNPAFLATDDDRYFSVDVQLGEVDASHGFQVLDNWARNRVRHPDKTHVAVLVTETAGDRYRTTLEALTEHLPLVVVELQAWRGEKEAMVVPSVVLASTDVELASTAVPARDEDGDDASDGQTADALAEGDGPDDVPEDRDDTGIGDPWKLPKRGSEDPESTEAGAYVGAASGD